MVALLIIGIDSTDIFGRLIHLPLKSHRGESHNPILLYNCISICSGSLRFCPSSRSPLAPFIAAPDLRKIPHTAPPPTCQQVRFLSSPSPRWQKVRRSQRGIYPKATNGRVPVLGGTPRGTALGRVVPQPAASGDDSPDNAESFLSFIFFVRQIVGVFPPRHPDIAVDSSGE